MERSEIKHFDYREHHCMAEFSEGTILGTSGIAGIIIEKGHPCYGKYKDQLHTLTRKIAPLSLFHHIELAWAAPTSQPSFRPKWSLGIRMSQYGVERGTIVTMDKLIEWICAIVDAIEEQYLENKHPKDPPTDVSPDQFASEQKKVAEEQHQLENGGPQTEKELLDWLATKPQDKMEELAMYHKHNKTVKVLVNKLKNRLDWISSI